MPIRQCDVTIAVYDESMGSKAPDFKLMDQDGVQHSLSDYAGRWVVLFFYPKDRSLNCTREVCAFRDESAIIGQFGNAIIIGINHESVESHKKFAVKNKLSFSLLSDPDHLITQAYGAWRSNKPKLYDRVFPTRRNTYLINPEGYIVKRYLTVDPMSHAEEVIINLQKLQADTLSRTSEKAHSRKD